MSRALVVIGATGGVGAGIVAAAIQGGYRVVAVGREGDKLAQLADRLGSPNSLILLPGTVEDDSNARALAQALRNLRLRFAGVVVSVNAPLTSARVINSEPALLRDTFERNVLTHFVAARHLVPLLGETSPGALYLVLGGGAADHVWAGYGHVSVGAAALKMLVRVLRDEAKDIAVRIHELQIDGMVCTHKNSRHACREWLNAIEVGEHVLDVLKRADASDPVLHLSAARPQR